MARVATVNFADRKHGDTFTAVEFRFFQSDGTTPLDLSDATLEIQIRKDNEDGRLYKTATSGDGITWLVQANGTFQFGGFDMNWGGAGDYHYAIEATYATSGITRTYVQGVIKVTADPTK